MGDQRPKAADISDDEFLAAVAEAVRRTPLCSTASRWDIGWVLSGYDGRARFTGDAPPGRYPEKVVLAKARALVRRGLILGCPCGCRGDFEVEASVDR